MNKGFATTLAITFLAVSLQVASAEQKRKLSLSEAVREAVANNFDVAIQRLEAKKATERRKAAEGYFDPSIDAQAVHYQEKTPATSAFADPAVGERGQNKASVGVSGALSHGTEYRVGLETGMATTNSRFANLDPEYGTSLTMKVTHPLLKGGGGEVNRWRIVSGLADESIARLRLEAKIGDIITRTEGAYWNMIYSRDLLKVENESLSLARDLLDRVRTQVEAGAMAQIEIIQAKTSVAERELWVIEAGNRLERDEDLLFSLISRDVSEDQMIDLTDKPVARKEPVDFKRGVEIALSSRPEINAAKKEIEKRKIALVYYANSELPALDLYATLSLNGVRGESTETVSVGGGDVNNISPYDGSWGESFSDSLGGDFYDYTLGVKFSIPIGARTSKAQIAEARFSVEKALLELKRLERDIMVEVRNAVRDIINGKKRVEAAQAARKLAEERLSAELVKFEAGASTSFTTLEYQKDLTIQKSNELLAIAGLKIAEARYHHATGMALQNAKLTLE